MVVIICETETDSTLCKAANLIIFHNQELSALLDSAIMGKSLWH